MKTSLDTSSVNIEEIRKSKIKRNVIVKGKKSYAIWILLVLIVIAFIFSFTVGAYSLSVSEIINVFYAKITGAATTYGTNVENVIFKVRMPRIFAAILIGCALSAAGSAYQGLFRNPMVAPDILGASGGAGLGAAIGLLLSFSSIEVQAISFVFGLAAVFLTIGINSAINRGGEGSVLSLILTGMVISSLCQAFISKRQASTNNILAYGRSFYCNRKRCIDYDYPNAYWDNSFIYFKMAFKCAFFWG